MNRSQGEDADSDANGEKEDEEAAEGDIGSCHQVVGKPKVSAVGKCVGGGGGWGLGAVGVACRVADSKSGQQGSDMAAAEEAVVWTLVRESVDAVVGNAFFMVLDFCPFVCPFAEYRPVSNPKYSVF